MPRHFFTYDLNIVKRYDWIQYEKWKNAEYLKQSWAIKMKIAWSRFQTILQRDSNQNYTVFVEIKTCWWAELNQRYKHIAAYTLIPDFW